MTLLAGRGRGQHVAHREHTACGRRATRAATSAPSANTRRSRAMCSRRICSNGASKIELVRTRHRPDAHARDRESRVPAPRADAVSRACRRTRRRVLLRRVMRLDDVRLEAVGVARAVAPPRRRRARRCCTPSGEVRRREQRAVRAARPRRDASGSCVVPAGRADDDRTPRRDDTRERSPAPPRAP